MKRLTFVRSMVFVVLVCALCLGGAPSTHAGDNHLAVGYTAVKGLESGDVFLPFGGYLAFNAKYFEIKGSIAYKRSDSGYESKTMILGGLGPRFSFGSSEETTPFVRLLVGAAWDSNTDDGGFLISPGGGVDLKVGKSTTLRLDVEVPVIRGDASGVGLQGSVGIRF